MGSHSSAFVQICAERLILTVVLTVVENAIVYIYIEYNYSNY